MKKLLYVLIAFAAQTAFSQWEPCMPDIIGSPISALHFSNGGIFVGTASGVSRSTDGGQNWLWNKLHRKGWAQSIFEADGKVYIGTRHGAYATTDNGANWEYIEIGDSLNWVFGFAKVSDKLFAATQRGVYVSDNGGASWGEKLADISMSTFCQITSVQNNLLITSRYDGNYFSSDEGKNWALVAEGVPFISVAKRGEKIYGLTYNGLYLSEDAGRSFQILDSLNPGQYTDIAADDTKLLIGRTAGVLIYDLTNKTWDSASINTERITKVGIFDGVYYAAAERDLYRSTDNGKTWSCPRPTVTARKTFVLSNSGKEILAGNDKGAFGALPEVGSWLKKNPDMANSFVYRLDSEGNTIVATIGDAADTVMVSENGGETWTLYGRVFEGESDQSINCIAVHGKNIYVGANTEFAVSTNLGATWKTVDALNGHEMFNIAVKGDSVWTKGLESDVHLSTDRGSTWTLQDDKLPFTISYEVEAGANRVAFLTKNAVYIKRDDEPVWMRKELPAESIYKFEIKGDTIMVSLYGGLLLSIDNGNSWKDVGQGFFDNEITDMAISDAYVFASTTNGIFKAKIEDFKLTSAKEEKITEVGLKVYPNPAGDYLNIETDKTNLSDFTTVKIYDLLGNIVKECPLETALSSRIDMKELSSGIYCVSLGEARAVFVKE